MSKSLLKGAIGYLVKWLGKPGFHAAMALVDKTRLTNH